MGRDIIIDSLYKKTKICCGVKDMKKILILILDHGDIVDDLFKKLSAEHYNATVLQARSIKHLLEDEESEHLHFFNLSHLEKNLYAGSTFCYFIVDSEKLDNLKNIIRNETETFKKIKGAMFAYDIPDYEGTF